MVPADILKQLLSGGRRPGGFFRGIRRLFARKPAVTVDLGQEPAPLFESRRDLTGRFKAGLSRFLRKFAVKKSRSFRGGTKRKSVLSERAGRDIRVVPYRAGEHSLAPLPTLLRAAAGGGYDLRTRRFAVHGADLAGWEKLQRQSLALVLVVDVSHSTHPFVRSMAEIIDSLTGYFRTHHDRVGLIALAGPQARIINHPTQNYRVVTKGLLALKVHGQTPLADGLQKALAMIRLEKFRKPGAASLVILLSDCYPEPLTHAHPDIFDEPAYRESLRAARLYRSGRVSLLVVNPTFRHREGEQLYPGERLSAAIAEEAGGRLIKLFPSESTIRFDGEGYAPPSAREIGQIISGIEDALGNRPLGEGKRMAI